ncbi:hypothetical protein BRADI_2g35635v3 [Brachypodium distachyon]|uniref:DRBM domain-containing protein n=1 Tax=Brachypodium distachyon TaxID=15368 RepID=A0A2K2DBX6_BRADI|nr:hypothetical protein BRADI_2g35635v3 [Brachypodium distachyon]
MEVMNFDGTSGEVVQMEEAVSMLLEHLVGPVLPRAATDVTPAEMERAVARQIHTAVILYNYYHRSLSPQLAFADVKRFLLCASHSVGEDLFPFSNVVHEKNPGDDVKPSVTDRAAMDACEIAEALDASQDFPEMSLWPIAKVAVLLLDPTRKKCVWSIIEKEFDASAGNSYSSKQLLLHRTSKIFALSVCSLCIVLLPYGKLMVLKGMKHANLHILDEDLTYSLSTERTITKLFIVEYEQTTNRELTEVPLQELVSSMSGPLFVNDPFPKTSPVVEHYHILPYKKSLLQFLHRERPSDYAVHEIAESMDQQEAKNKSMMQKGTKKVSTAKQKQAIKLVDTSPDGENPVRENDPLVVDLDTSKQTTKYRNIKEAAAASGGKLILQAGVQVDKEKTQSSDITPDVFPTKAPSVGHVTENIILEGQNMGASENSGGIMENNNDQMYHSLQLIQKMRDDFLHKKHILAERSAQCDMDIQTILSEGKMTSIVKSIMDKYKNNSSNKAEATTSSLSGGGGQTLTTKRLKLREAPLLGKKCQELDDICRDSNWMLPRYTVLPSKDGMFDACVNLRGFDFDMRINGDRCMTPYEARCSAAAHMIVELQKKAEKE